MTCALIYFASLPIFERIKRIKDQLYNDLWKIFRFTTGLNIEPCVQTHTLNFDKFLSTSKINIFNEAGRFI